MRHNHTYLLLFSLVAFLLLPHTAFAKESPHKPIASLRVSVISGIPDILGASLSLKMFHPFELEAGASSLVLGYSFYGKAGASLQIFDNRLPIGTGWSVRGLLMGGYRFIQGEIFGNATSHAVMLTAGIEATLCRGSLATAALRVAA